MVDTRSFKSLFTAAFSQLSPGLPGRVVGRAIVAKIGLCKMAISKSDTIYSVV